MISRRKRNLSAQLLVLASTLPVSVALHAAPEDEPPRIENSSPDISRDARVEGRRDRMSRSSRRARQTNEGREVIGELAPVRIRERRLPQRTPTYMEAESASSKLVKPLVDTPQTITVINKELLATQQATTLTEALRNTPGITLQLGENGNTSSGDTFQMRGFSTQASIFNDGIRDLGAVTRDVFNLEQLEVIKGAGGSEAGRGISSGYINISSKLPQKRDANSVTASLGSGDFKRITGDFNYRFSENMAGRLNVLWQDSGIDGRDFVSRKVNGIAPSVVFGLDTPTQVYLYSQHVRQEGIPDGGIPTVGMPGYYRAAGSGVTQEQADALNKAARVRRENFYGSPDDNEKTEADMYTIKVVSDLGGGLKLDNLTRYGKSSNKRSLTGVFTANAVNAADPGTWTLRRIRQGFDQENSILANQTNLRGSLAMGQGTSDFVIGLEILREQQKNTALSVTGTQIDASLYNPNPNDPFLPFSPTGAFSHGQTDTASIYAINSFNVTPKLQLDTGLRLDHYKTVSDGLTVSTSNNVTTRTPYRIEGDGNLFSWRVGGLYKPTTASSVYLNFSRALTPPGSANFSLSTSTTSINNPNVDPQEIDNWELGAKQELMNRRLMLTGALYRTTNKNQFTQDPVTGEYLQEGETRVQGVELGAVGKVTPAWQVMAGLAYSKTEPVNSQSVNTTTKAVTETTAVRWSPELTGSLWSDYSAGDWKFGLGARYVSDQKRVVSQTIGATPVPANMPEIPAYWVTDGMVSYKVNRNMDISLNGYNLLDENYISSLNNSGARMVLGAPRSGKLSLTYRF